MSFLKLLFGEPRLSDDDIKRIAREVRLSDTDIKKISREIVESDKETGRLAKEVVIDLDTIDRLAKRIIAHPIFYIGFPIILLILVFVGYFTIIKSTISEVKDDARQVKEDAKTLLGTTRKENEASISSLKADLQRQLADFSTNAYKQMTTNIQSMFQRETFTTIVDDVVSNKATELLLTKVYPSITNFDYRITNSFNGLQPKMDDLKSRLTSIQLAAETNLLDLRSEAELYLIIAKANAGDRAAFGQLYPFKDGTNSSLGYAANLSINSIVSRVSSEGALGRTLVFGIDPWKGSTNAADKASLNEYRKQFSTLQNDIQQIVLLRQLRAQDRFPLNDRLRVLAWVLEFHNRLALLDEACNLMESEAKLGLNFLGSNQYVEWFETKYNTKVELIY